MLTLAGCLEAIESDEEIHLDLDPETLQRLARCQSDRAWEMGPCEHEDLWPLEMPESWLE
jgi:hypothetical protein